MTVRSDAGQSASGVFAMGCVEIITPVDGGYIKELSDFAFEKISGPSFIDKTIENMREDNKGTITRYDLRSNAVEVIAGKSDRPESMNCPEGDLPVGTRWVASVVTEFGSEVDRRYVVEGLEKVSRVLCARISSRWALPLAADSPDLPHKLQLTEWFSVEGGRSVKMTSDATMVVNNGTVRLQMENFREV